MSLFTHKFTSLEQMDEINARKKIKTTFKLNIETLIGKRNNTAVKSNACIPIAFISGNLTKSVNAKCRIVRLSKDTLNKQLNKHLDVMTNGIFCHDNIQKLIDFGLVIKEGRNNYKRVILFVGQLTDINNTTKWYKLAIKVTTKGHEMYLTSLHPISQKLKQNILDNGERIRGNIIEARKPSKSQKYVFSVIIITLLSILYLLIAKPTLYKFKMS